MCVSPFPQMKSISECNFTEFIAQLKLNNFLFVIEPKPELNENLYFSDCLFVAGTSQSFLESAKLLSTPIHFFFFNKINHGKDFQLKSSINLK